MSLSAERNMNNKTLVQKLLNLGFFDSHLSEVRKSLYTKRTFSKDLRHYISEKNSANLLKLLTKKSKNYIENEKKWKNNNSFNLYELNSHNEDKFNVEVIKILKSLKNFKGDLKLEKLKKDNDVVVVYFGNKKEELDEFIKAARKNEDFPFANVESEDIAKKLGIKMSTVVMFRNFEEAQKELTGELKLKKIEEFIDAYSSPKVMNFDEKAAQIIFGKAIPAIMLYCSKDSDKWEEYKKLMTTISEKINGKLKVVQTDIKEGMASRLAEYIGVKESDLPSVRIADTRVDLKKYNMEGEINEKNILQFIEDWENNKLKPHLKSAEEPKENNGDVLVVVGKTYEREVINNRKDVMLLFYAPWCGHCKALHPKYEEVAKKLKEKNPKLVMAKIDATENEVENINISGFPTIKFYAGDRKGKMPIDYDGDRTVEDIIKFIKKNAANPIVYDEDKTETKDEKPKQDKTEEL